MDYALKAHLFGYLFSRDNLSVVNRELVTIGTLIALENVPNQLTSHLQILRDLGLPQSELAKLIEQLAPHNPTATEKAKAVLQGLTP